MLTIKESADQLTFVVYVQPRSSRISIVGSHQQALKIKLTAPPVDGAANKQCLQVLAKALGLPKSALTIISGQASRLKQIRIQSTANSFTPSELKALKHKLFQLSKKTS